MLVFSKEKFVESMRDNYSLEAIEKYCKDWANECDGKRIIIDEITGNRYVVIEPLYLSNVVWEVEK